MDLDKPICNNKNCKHSHDLNCVALKYIRENCHYLYVLNQNNKLIEEVEMLNELLLEKDYHKLRGFGTTLRYYRKEKGMSQKFIGEKIEKTGQYISYLERNKGANPSLKTIKDIVRVLKIRVRDLI